jgi:hypothetical protein
MLKVLHDHGLLSDDINHNVTQHALCLLCLSAFFGPVSFARVVRILAVIWSVWEENVDPAEMHRDDQDLQTELLLRDWQPPEGGKPS